MPICDRIHGLERRNTPKLRCTVHPPGHTQLGGGCPAAPAPAAHSATAQESPLFAMMGLTGFCTIERPDATWGEATNKKGDLDHAPMILLKVMFYSPHRQIPFGDIFVTFSSGFLKQIHVTAQPFETCSSLEIHETTTTMQQNMGISIETTGRTTLLTSQLRLLRIWDGHAGPRRAAPLAKPRVVDDGRWGARHEEFFESPERQVA